MGGGRFWKFVAGDAVAVRRDDGLVRVGQYMGRLVRRPRGRIVGEYRSNSGQKWSGSGQMVVEVRRRAAHGQAGAVGLSSMVYGLWSVVYTLHSLLYTLYRQGPAGWASPAGAGSPGLGQPLARRGGSDGCTCGAGPAVRASCGARLRARGGGVGRGWATGGLRTWWRCRRRRCQCRFLGHVPRAVALLAQMARLGPADSNVLARTGLRPALHDSDMTRTSPEPAFDRLLALDRSSNLP